MIVILGIDGLEYEYVKKFNVKNLMQESFGKTNISEFSEPRTMVLWSSFLTGKNNGNTNSLHHPDFVCRLLPSDSFRS